MNINNTGKDVYISRIKRDIFGCDIQTHWVYKWYYSTKGYDNQPRPYNIKRKV